MNDSVKPCGHDFSFEYIDACSSCAEYRWVLHDFWCQVAIAALLRVVQINEQTLGFKGEAFVGDYWL